MMGLTGRHSSPPYGSMSLTHPGASRVLSQYALYLLISVFDCHTSLPMGYFFLPHPLFFL